MSVPSADDPFNPDPHSESYYVPDDSQHTPHRASVPEPDRLKSWSQSFSRFPSITRFTAQRNQPANKDDIRTGHPPSSPTATTRSESACSVELPPIAEVDESLPNHGIGENCKASKHKSLETPDRARKVFKRNIL